MRKFTIKVKAGPDASLGIRDDSGSGEEHVLPLRKGGSAKEADNYTEKSEASMATFQVLPPHTTIGKPPKSPKSSLASQLFSPKPFRSPTRTATKFVEGSFLTFLTQKSSLDGANNIGASQSDVRSASNSACDIIQPVKELEANKTEEQLTTSPESLSRDRRGPAQSSFDPQSSPGCILTDSDMFSSGTISSSVSPVTVQSPKGRARVATDPNLESQKLSDTSSVPAESHIPTSGPVSCSTRVLHERSTPVSSPSRHSEDWRHTAFSPQNKNLQTPEVSAGSESDAQTLSYRNRAAATPKHSTPKPRARPRKTGSVDKECTNVTVTSVQFNNEKPNSNPNTRGSLDRTYKHSADHCKEQNVARDKNSYFQNDVLKSIAQTKDVSTGAGTDSKNDMSENMNNLRHTCEHQTASQPLNTVVSVQSIPSDFCVAFRDNPLLLPVHNQHTYRKSLKSELALPSFYGKWPRWRRRRRNQNGTAYGNTVEENPIKRSLKRCHDKNFSLHGLTISAILSERKALENWAEPFPWFVQGKPRTTTSFCHGKQMTGKHHIARAQEKKEAPSELSKICLYRGKHKMEGSDKEPLSLGQPNRDDSSFLRDSQHDMESEMSEKVHDSCSRIDDSHAATGQMDEKSVSDERTPVSVLIQRMTRQIRERTSTSFENHVSVHEKAKLSKNTQNDESELQGTKQSRNMRQSQAVLSPTVTVAYKGGKTPVKELTQKLQDYFRSKCCSQAVFQGNIQKTKERMGDSSLFSRQEPTEDIMPYSLKRSEDVSHTLASSKNFLFNQKKEMDPKVHVEQIIDGMSTIHDWKLKGTHGDMKCLSHRHTSVFTDKTREQAGASGTDDHMHVDSQKEGTVKTGSAENRTRIKKLELNTKPAARKSVGHSAVTISTQRLQPRMRTTENLIDAAVKKIHTCRDVTDPGLTDSCLKRHRTITVQRRPEKKETHSGCEEKYATAELPVKKNNACKEQREINALKQYFEFRIMNISKLTELSVKDRERPPLNTQELLKKLDTLQRHRESGVEQEKARHQGFSTETNAVTSLRVPEDTTHQDCPKSTSQGWAGTPSDLPAAGVVSNGHSANLNEQRNQTDGIELHLSHAQHPPCICAEGAERVRGLMNDGNTNAKDKMDISRDPCENEKTKTTISSSETFPPFQEENKLEGESLENEFQKALKMLKPSSKEIESDPYSVTELSKQFDALQKYEESGQGLDAGEECSLRETGAEVSLQSFHPESVTCRESLRKSISLDVPVVRALSRRCSANPDGEKTEVIQSEEINKGNDTRREKTASITNLNENQETSKKSRDKGSQTFTEEEEMNGLQDLPGITGHFISLVALDKIIHDAELRFRTLFHRYTHKHSKPESKGSSPSNETLSISDIAKNLEKELSLETFSGRVQSLQSSIEELISGLQPLSEIHLDVDDSQTLKGEVQHTSEHIPSINNDASGSSCDIPSNTGSTSVEEIIDFFEKYDSGGAKVKKRRTESVEIEVHNQIKRVLARKARKIKSILQKACSLLQEVNEMIRSLESQTKRIMHAGEFTTKCPEAHRQARSSERKDNRRPVTLQNVISKPRLKTQQSGPTTSSTENRLHEIIQLAKHFILCFPSILVSLTDLTKKLKHENRFTHGSRLKGRVGTRTKSKKSPSILSRYSNAASPPRRPFFKTGTCDNTSLSRLTQAPTRTMAATRIVALSDATSSCSSSLAEKTSHLAAEAEKHANRWSVKNSIVQKLERMGRRSSSSDFSGKRARVSSEISMDDLQKRCLLNKKIVLSDTIMKQCTEHNTTSKPVLTNDKREGTMDVADFFSAISFGYKPSPNRSTSEAKFKSFQETFSTPSLSNITSSLQNKKTHLAQLKTGNVSQEFTVKADTKSHLYPGPKIDQLVIKPSFQTRTVSSHSNIFISGQTQLAKVSKGEDGRANTLPLDVGDGSNASTEGLEAPAAGCSWPENAGVLSPIADIFSPKACNESLPKLDFTKQTLPFLQASTSDVSTENGTQPQGYLSVYCSDVSTVPQRMPDKADVLPKRKRKLPQICQTSSDERVTGTFSTEKPLYSLLRRGLSEICKRYENINKHEENNKEADYTASADSTARKCRQNSSTDICSRAKNAISKGSHKSFLSDDHTGCLLTAEHSGDKYYGGNKTVSTDKKEPYTLPIFQVRPSVENLVSDSQTRGVSSEYMFYDTHDVPSGMTYASSQNVFSAGFLPNDEQCHSFLDITSPTGESLASFQSLDSACVNGHGQERSTEEVCDRLGSSDLIKTAVTENVAQKTELSRKKGVIWRTGDQFREMPSLFSQDRNGVSPALEQKGPASKPLDRSMYESTNIPLVSKRSVGVSAPVNNEYRSLNSPVTRSDSPITQSMDQGVQNTPSDNCSDHTLSCESIIVCSETIRTFSDISDDESPVYLSPNKKQSSRPRSVSSKSTNTRRVKDNIPSHDIKTVPSERHRSRSCNRNKSRQTCNATGDVPSSFPDREKRTSAALIGNKRETRRETGLDEKSADAIEMVLKDVNKDDKNKTETEVKADQYLSKQRKETMLQIVHSFRVMGTFFSSVLQHNLANDSKFADLLQRLFPPISTKTAASELGKSQKSSASIPVRSGVPEGDQISDMEPTALTPYSSLEMTSAARSPEQQQSPVISDSFNHIDEPYEASQLKRKMRVQPSRTDQHFKPYFRRDRPGQRGTPENFDNAIKRFRDTVGSLKTKINHMIDMIKADHFENSDMIEADRFENGDSESEHNTSRSACTSNVCDAEMRTSTTMKTEKCLTPWDEKQVSFFTFPSKRMHDNEEKPHHKNTADLSERSCNIIHPSHDQLEQNVVFENLKTRQKILLTKQWDDVSQTSYSRASVRKTKSPMIEMQDYNGIWEKRDKTSQTEDALQGILNPAGTVFELCSISDNTLGRANETSSANHSFQSAVSTSGTSDGLHVLCLAAELGKNCPASKVSDIQNKIKIISHTEATLPINRNQHTNDIGRSIYQKEKDREKVPPGKCDRLQSTLLSSKRKSVHSVLNLMETNHQTQNNNTLDRTHQIFTHIEKEGRARNDCHHFNTFHLKDAGISEKIKSSPGDEQLERKISSTDSKTKFGPRCNSFHKDSKVRQTTDSSTQQMCRNSIYEKEVTSSHVSFRRKKADFTTTLQNYSFKASKCTCAPPLAHHHLSCTEWTTRLSHGECMFEKAQPAASVIEKALPTRIKLKNHTDLKLKRSKSEKHFERSLLCTCSKRSKSTGGVTDCAPPNIELSLKTTPELSGHDSINTDKKYNEATRTHKHNIVNCIRCLRSERHVGRMPCPNETITTPVKSISAACHPRYSKSALRLDHILRRQQPGSCKDTTSAVMTNAEKVHPTAYCTLCTPGKNTKMERNETKCEFKKCTPICKNDNPATCPLKHMSQESHVGRSDFPDPVESSMSSSELELQQILGPNFLSASGLGYRKITPSKAITPNQGRFLRERPDLTTATSSNSESQTYDSRVPSNSHTSAEEETRSRELASEEEQILTFAQNLKGMGKFCFLRANHPPNRVIRDEHSHYGTCQMHDGLDTGRHVRTDKRYTCMIPLQLSLGIDAEDENKAREESTYLSLNSSPARARKPYLTDLIPRFPFRSKVHSEKFYDVDAKWPVNKFLSTDRSGIIFPQGNISIPQHVDSSSIFDVYPTHLSCHEASVFGTSRPRATFTQQGGGCSRPKRVNGVSAQATREKQGVLKKMIKKVQERFSSLAEYSVSERQEHGHFSMHQLFPRGKMKQLQNVQHVPFSDRVRMHGECLTKSADHGQIQHIFKSNTGSSVCSRGNGSNARKLFMTKCENCDKTQMIQFSVRGTPSTGACFQGLESSWSQPHSGERKLVSPSFIVSDTDKHSKAAKMFGNKKMKEPGTLLAACLAQEEDTRGKVELMCRFLKSCPGRHNFQKENSGVDSTSSKVNNNSFRESHQMSGIRARNRNLCNSSDHVSHTFAECNDHDTEMSLTKSTLQPKPFIYTDASYMRKPGHCEGPFCRQSCEHSSTDQFHSLPSSPQEESCGMVESITKKIVHFENGPIGSGRNLDPLEAVRGGDNESAPFNRNPAFRPWNKSHLTKCGILNTSYELGSLLSQHASRPIVSDIYKERSSHITPSSYFHRSGLTRFERSKADSKQFIEIVNATPAVSDELKIRKCALKTQSGTADFVSPLMRKAPSAQLHGGRCAHRRINIKQCKNRFLREHVLTRGHPDSFPDVGNNSSYLPAHSNTKPHHEKRELGTVTDQQTRGKAVDRWTIPCANSGLNQNGCNCSFSHLPSVTCMPASSFWLIPQIAACSSEVFSSFPHNQDYVNGVGKPQHVATPHAKLESSCFPTSRSVKQNCQSGHREKTTAVYREKEESGRSHLSCITQSKSVMSEAGPSKSVRQGSSHCCEQCDNGVAAIALNSVHVSGDSTSSKVSTKSQKKVHFWSTIPDMENLDTMAYLFTPIDDRDFSSNSIHHIPECDINFCVQDQLEVTCSDTQFMTPVSVTDTKPATNCTETQNSHNPKCLLKSSLVKESCMSSELMFSVKSCDSASEKTMTSPTADAHCSENVTLPERFYVATSRRRDPHACFVTSVSRYKVSKNACDPQNDEKHRKKTVTKVVQKMGNEEQDAACELLQAQRRHFRCVSSTNKPTRTASGPLTQVTTKTFEDAQLNTTCYMTKQRSCFERNKSRQLTLGPPSSNLEKGSFTTHYSSFTTDCETDTSTVSLNLCNLDSMKSHPFSSHNTGECSLQRRSSSVETGTSSLYYAERSNNTRIFPAMVAAAVCASAKTGKIFTHENTPNGGKHPFPNKSLSLVTVNARNTTVQTPTKTSLSTGKGAVFQFRRPCLAQTLQTRRAVVTSADDHCLSKSRPSPKEAFVRCNCVRFSKATSRACYSHQTQSSDSRKVRQAQCNEIEDKSKVSSSRPKGGVGTLESKSHHSVALLDHQQNPYLQASSEGKCAVKTNESISDHYESFHLCKRVPSHEGEIEAFTNRVNLQKDESFSSFPDHTSITPHSDHNRHLSVLPAVQENSCLKTDATHYVSSVVHSCIEAIMKVVGTSDLSEFLTTNEPHSTEHAINRSFSQSQETGNGHGRTSHSLKLRSPVTDENSFPKDISATKNKGNNSKYRYTGVTNENRCPKKSTITDSIFDAISRARQFAERKWKQTDRNHSDCISSSESTPLFTPLSSSSSSNTTIHLTHEGIALNGPVDMSPNTSFSYDSFISCGKPNPNLFSVTAAQTPGRSPLSVSVTVLSSPETKSQSPQHACLSPVKIQHCRQRMDEGVCTLTEEGTKTPAKSNRTRHSAELRNDKGAVLDEKAKRAMRVVKSGSTTVITENVQQSISTKKPKSPMKFIIKAEPTSNSKTASSYTIHVAAPGNICGSTERLAALKRGSQDEDDTCIFTVTEFKTKGGEAQNSYNCPAVTLGSPKKGSPEQYDTCICPLEESKKKGEFKPEPLIEDTFPKCVTTNNKTINVEQKLGRLPVFKSQSFETEQASRKEDNTAILRCEQPPPGDISLAQFHVKMQSPRRLSPTPQQYEVNASIGATDKESCEGKLKKVSEVTEIVSEEVPAHVETLGSPSWYSAESWNQRWISSNQRFSNDDALERMSAALSDLTQNPSQLGNSDRKCQKNVRNFRLAKRSNSTFISVIPSWNVSNSRHRLKTMHSVSMVRNSDKKPKRLTSAKAGSRRRLRQARRLLRIQEGLVSLHQQTLNTLRVAVRLTRRDIVQEKIRAKRVKQEAALRQARGKCALRKCQVLVGQVAPDALEQLRDVLGCSQSDCCTSISDAGEKTNTTSSGAGTISVDGENKRPASVIAGTCQKRLTKPTTSSTTSQRKRALYVCTCPPRRTQHVVCSSEPHAEGETSILGHKQTGGDCSNHYSRSPSPLVVQDSVCSSAPGSLSTIILQQKRRKVAKSVSESSLQYWYPAITTGRFSSFNKKKTQAVCSPASGRYQGPARDHATHCSPTLAETVNVMRERCGNSVRIKPRHCRKSASDCRVLSDVPVKTNSSSTSTAIHSKNKYSACSRSSTPKCGQVTLSSGKKKAMLKQAPRAAISGEDKSVRVPTDTGSRKGLLKKNKCFFARLQSLAKKVAIESLAVPLGGSTRECRFSRSQLNMRYFLSIDDLAHMVAAVAMAAADRGITQHWKTFCSTILPGLQKEFAERSFQVRRERMKIICDTSINAVRTNKNDHKLRKTSDAENAEKQHLTDSEMTHSMKTDDDLSCAAAFVRPQTTIENNRTNISMERLECESASDTSVEEVFWSMEDVQASEQHTRLLSSSLSESVIDPEVKYADKQVTYHGVSPSRRRKSKPYTYKPAHGCVALPRYQHCVIDHPTTSQNGRKTAVISSDKRIFCERHRHSLCPSQETRLPIEKVYHSANQSDNNTSTHYSVNSRDDCVHANRPRKVQRTMQHQTERDRHMQQTTECEKRYQRYQDQPRLRNLLTSTVPVDRQDPAQQCRPSSLQGSVSRGISSVTFQKPFRPFSNMNTY